MEFVLFLVTIGAASECMNEWADEDAGIEAVQRIADTLDDIAALQDPEVDPDVLISMLRDTKLHELLKVMIHIQIDRNFLQYLQFAILVV